MTALVPPGPGIVLMVGASGSGKSTLADTLAVDLGARVISYDECRRELAGDPGEQSVSAAAVALAHGRMVSTLAEGIPVVLDGTHLRGDHRASVRAIAGALSVWVVAVVLDTPLSVCLAGQRGRGRRVPSTVVTDQHHDLRVALPGLLAEEYDALHVLRPGGQTDVA